MGKLFVASHEFFHAWNVKRLRPLPLGPFDYTQMVHTPSLWISEGLTSYYGELNLVRAGLLTPEKYLELMGRAITNFEATPARQERSIEDTSWDTWYSRSVVSQENNLRNTNYSYYDGGQVMGHILDFAIRHDTGNVKSLDDWMRLLYSRYALPKAGFQPDDAVKAANEIAGKDVSALFAKYIAGKEAIPYEEYFGYAGNYGGEEDRRDEGLGRCFVCAGCNGYGAREDSAILFRGARRKARGWILGMRFTRWMGGRWARMM